MLLTNDPSKGATPVGDHRGLRLSGLLQRGRARRGPRRTDSARRRSRPRCRRRARCATAEQGPHRGLSGVVRGRPAALRLSWPPPCRRAKRKRPGLVVADRSWGGFGRTSGSFCMSQISGTRWPRSPSEAW